MLHQAIAQQPEVVGLLARHLHPVEVERVGHAREAPGEIGGEIDRVELDVGERVHQRRETLGRLQRPLLHLGVADHLRPRRPARDARWLGDRLAGADAVE